MPTDYNLKFDPSNVYYYVGNIKYDFRKVDWADVGSYLTDQFVYAVDKSSKKIKTNHPELAPTAITVAYTSLPADYTATDGSQDTNVEASPDITAITLLAIAYWWLAKERDKQKYNEFKAEYDAQVRADITEDEATIPVKFFRPVRPYLIRGYVSKF